MRRTTVALLALVCLVAACGRRDKGKGAKPAAAVAVSETPGSKPVGPAVTPPDPTPRPQIQLNLRSSPPGATVSVDGKAVGQTPVIAPVTLDGKPHEFSFSLQGYDSVTYRFPPTRDGGVVHATLKKQPQPGEGKDATMAAAPAGAAKQ